MELSSQQLAILERLYRAGFEIVAFPMYANHVGIRKGGCAALLAANMPGSFTLYGSPAYLINGNFSVRIKRDSHEYFVWKKEKLEATATRLAELSTFSEELSQLLLPQI